MRDINRIDVVLGLIKRVWVTYPDMRFGQLLENIEPNFNNWWNMEEDQWIEAIKNFEKKLSKKFEEGMS